MTTEQFTEFVVLGTLLNLFITYGRRNPLHTGYKTFTNVGLVSYLLQHHEAREKAAGFQCKSTGK